MDKGIMQAQRMYLTAIFTVIALEGASSQNNCLTWKIRKDHALELSCKLYKVSEKVRIYDSKKRHDVHCPNQETCKAHSNEREEITFTLTVPSNYEDQWFCVNRNNTLSTNISTSKGFLSSTKLKLRGQLRTDKIYILSCSTCWNIDGLSVEFLVNDNSEDSVRYVDNKCYHRKQLCLENRCSCSPNEYNWTFDANNKPEIHNITCKMEFKDSERNCRKTQMITLLVDGQEFETVLAPSILHGECKDSSIQDKDNIILPGTGVLTPRQIDGSPCKSCEVYIIVMVILGTVNAGLILLTAYVGYKWYQASKELTKIHKERHENASKELNKIHKERHENEEAQSLRHSNGDNENGQDS